MYLLDRVKRHGLGRELFARARAWLTARGVTSMSVWVLEGNTAARGFYEALAAVRRGGANRAVMSPCHRGLGLAS